MNWSARPIVVASKPTVGMVVRLRTTLSVDCSPKVRWNSVLLIKHSTTNGHTGLARANAKVPHSKPNLK